MSSVSNNLEELEELEELFESRTIINSSNIDIYFKLLMLVDEKEGNRIRSIIDHACLPIIEENKELMIKLKDDNEENYDILKIFKKINPIKNTQLQNLDFHIKEVLNEIFSGKDANYHFHFQHIFRGWDGNECEFLSEHPKYGLMKMLFKSMIKYLSIKECMNINHAIITFISDFAKENDNYVFRDDTVLVVMRSDDYECCFRVYV